MDLINIRFCDSIKVFVEQKQIELSIRMNLSLLDPDAQQIMNVGQGIYFFRFRFGPTPWVKVS